jgi:hypothetical protein
MQVTAVNKVSSQRYVLMYFRSVAENGHSTHLEVNNDLDLKA